LLRRLLRGESSRLLEALLLKKSRVKSLLLRLTSSLLLKKGLTLLDELLTLDESGVNLTLLLKAASGSGLLKLSLSGQERRRKGEVVQVIATVSGSGDLLLDAGELDFLSSQEFSLISRELEGRESGTGRFSGLRSGGGLSALLRREKSVLLLRLTLLAGKQLLLSLELQQLLLCERLLLLLRLSLLASEGLLLSLKLQNLLLVKRLLLLRLSKLLLLTSKNLLLLLELQKLSLTLSLDLLELLGGQSVSLLLSESRLLGKREGSGKLKLRLLGKGGSRSSLLRLLRPAKREDGGPLLESWLRLLALASLELLVQLQQSLDLSVVIEGVDLLLSQLGTLRGSGGGGSGLLGRKGRGLRSYFGESNSGDCG